MSKSIQNDQKNSSKDQNSQKWRNRRNFKKTRRKKNRLRAWLGDQIGWGAILARGPDWLGGQIGLYLILHLVNNSTLSTYRLSQVSTFKKNTFLRSKNIFNDQIY